MLTHTLSKSDKFVKPTSSESVKFVKRTLSESVKFAHEGAERPVVRDLVAQVHPHAEAGHHQVTDRQVEQQQVRRRPHLLVRGDDEQNHRVPHNVRDHSHDVEGHLEGDVPGGVLQGRYWCVHHLQQGGVDNHCIKRGARDAHAFCHSDSRSLLLAVRYQIC